MVSTQNSVQPGNQVMLGSGIYGTVVSVADDTLQLEVSPGTAVKVARQAVVKVVEPDFAPGATRDSTVEPDTGSGPVIDEQ